jgi:hypothetical protein
MLEYDSTMWKTYRTHFSGLLGRSVHVWVEVEFEKNTIYREGWVFIDYNTRQSWVWPTHDPIQYTVHTIYKTTYILCSDLYFWLGKLSTWRQPSVEMCRRHASRCGAYTLQKNTTLSAVLRLQTSPPRGCPFCQDRDTISTLSIDMHSVKETGYYYCMNAQLCVQWEQ